MDILTRSHCVGKWGTCVLLMLCVMRSDCGGADVAENPVVVPMRLTPSAHVKTMAGETKQLYDNWQELKKRKLRLLPVPKELKFTGDAIDANSIVIVLANRTRQGEIAANEIISRMKELSGADVPLAEEPQKGKFNVIIENDFPNSFTQKAESLVRAVNPYCKEQAYAIEPTDNGVRIAGASPVGMMYAAVTLRWLIEWKGDKVVLYPAHVVDWPDFPRRLLLYLQTANPRSQGYLKSKDPEVFIKYQKSMIDWAFRYKINMVFRQTAMAGTVTPFDKDEWLASKADVFKMGKPVGDYLKEHGMAAFDGNPVEFDKVTNGPPRPELAGCAVFKFGSGDSYGSWACDELHRRKAEKLTEFWRSCGYSTAFIHDFDNIACWQTRDRHTQEQYGDDRAKANIGMFNIYYDEFKKRGLEFAMVLLPYHGYAFLPEGIIRRDRLSDTPEVRKSLEKRIEENSRFIRRVSGAFPQDVLVCMREGERKEMLNFYDLIKGHPAVIYYQEFQPDEGYGSRFLPATIATFATAFDPGRKQNDIFWYESAVGPHGSVCASEYAWNTKFPGGNEAMLGNDKDTYALGVNDPAMMDILAERAAVGLWGDDYGQLLKTMMNTDLSLAYPFFERFGTKGRYENYLPNLMANEKFLKQADKALDAAWKMDMKARRLGRGFMDGFVYEYFAALRNVVKAAVVFNGANSAYERAKEEMIKGEKRKADAIIDDALKKLSKDAARYESSRKEMVGVFDPGFTYLSKPLAKIISANLLNPNSIDDLKSKLERLKNDKKLLNELTFQPKWFEDFMRKRPLTAVKAATPPTIDGKLDEQAWGNATPIENFINIKDGRPEKRPIVMKMLWDDENIYVGGEISQPLAATIKVQPHPESVYGLEESVELFLQPDAGKNKYFQFMLDIGGNIFRSRRDEKADSKGSAQKVAGTVKVSGDKWTFELKVPCAALEGARIGAGWRGLLCHNALGDPAAHLRHRFTNYTSSFTKDTVHNSSMWGDILFETTATLPDPELKVLLENSSIKTVTISEGTGSLLSFRYYVESRRPVYDLKITGELLSSSGEKLCAPFDLLKSAYVPIASPRIDMDKEIKTRHDKVTLLLTSDFRTSDGKSYNKKDEFEIGENR